MMLLFGVMLAIGIFRMPYLYRVTIIGFGALCVVNAFRLVRGRGVKWHGFRYTRNRHYLAVVVLLLPCIVTRPPLIFWMTFVVSGILGILAESLFGLYWQQLFGEKIWIYLKAPIFSGHSSWLNVIPWGIGGAFYHSLTQKVLYAVTADDLLLFWTLSLVLFLGVSVWRTVKETIPPTVRSLTVRNYLIAFFPCIGSLVITSLVSGHYQILVAASFYAVGGWVMEYFLGKIMAFFLTDQLWVYIPDPMDNGHLTAWTLLPFMFGGFWFVSLSHMFTSFE